MNQFRGGPLEDGRQSQIQSLIVHMIGDGRFSIGAYVQVYDEDIPLGVFEWHPKVEYDENGDPISPV
jgi:hypothetical protein